MGDFRDDPIYQEMLRKLKAMDAPKSKRRAKSPAKKKRLPKKLRHLERLP